MNSFATQPRNRSQNKYSQIKGKQISPTKQSYQVFSAPESPQAAHKTYMSVEESTLVKSNNLESGNRRSVESLRIDFEGYNMEKV